VVNVSIALASGATLPSGWVIPQALLVGFLGHGASLVLFVLALRGLGAARTGAYFCTERVTAACSRGGLYLLRPVRSAARVTWFGLAEDFPRELAPGNRCP
jgi:hypothetical protein